MFAITVYGTSSDSSDSNENFDLNVSWDDNIDVDYENICANGNNFDRMLVYAMSKSGVPANFIEFGSTEIFDDVLQWTDEQILNHRKAAELYFFNNFGVDFSTVEIDDVYEVKTVSNLQMTTLTVSPDVGYRLLLDTADDISGYEQLKDCPKINDGAWVWINLADQTLPSGLFIKQGDMFAYGLYVIQKKDEGDIEIFSYASNLPLRAFDLDGYVVLKCELWYPDENFEPVGEVGATLGSWGVRPNVNDPTTVDVRQRNVLFFPGVSPDF